MLHLSQPLRHYHHHRNHIIITINWVESKSALDFKSFPPAVYYSNYIILGTETWKSIIIYAMKREEKEMILKISCCCLPVFTSIVVVETTAALWQTQENVIKLFHLERNIMLFKSFQTAGRVLHHVDDRQHSCATPLLIFNHSSSAFFCSPPAYCTQFYYSNQLCVCVLLKPVPKLYCGWKMERKNDERLKNEVKASTLNYERSRA